MNETFIERFLNGARDLPSRETLHVSGEQGDCEITVARALRILPGKRVVCEAEQAGRRVLIKIFATQKKGIRERQTEQNVHSLLQSAGIRCPQLLYAGATPDQRVQAVVYEFLDHAVSAAQQWRCATTEQQLALWQRVSRLLASMHEAGLYQDDIHLDNFLFADDQFYVIDLGSIRETNPPPVAPREAIKNLASLIAQFNLRDRGIAMNNLQPYCDGRGIICSDAFRHDIYVEADKLWQRRRKKYLQKIFRDCTEIRVQHSWYQVSAAKRKLCYGDVAQLIADPQRFMADGQMLHDKHAVTVAKLTLGGFDWLVKRYDDRRRLRPCMQHSQAALSWQHAHHVQMIGIATPAPLAYVEKRFGPVRLASYFITEHVPAETLYDALQHRVVSDAELRQIALMFRLLSSEQLSLHNLGAKSILLGKDSQLLLTDLAKMQQHKQRHAWASAFREDIEDFLKCWQGTNREKFITMLETERFLEPM